MAIYFLDWDSNSRAQNTTSTNAFGTTLDSRPSSHFEDGKCLPWSTIVRTPGLVVSGISCD